MIERTLAIIKPDAVKKNVIGEIIAMITKANFKILAFQLTKITQEQAGFFYEVHKERFFYNDLKDYMSSGAIVPLVLEKENAVEDFRKLIGDTDPTKAADDTVRKLYGESKAVNAVHGSDSVQNALNEISFFYCESAIVINLS